MRWLGTNFPPTRNTVHHIGNLCIVSDGFQKPCRIIRRSNLTNYKNHTCGLVQLAAGMDGMGILTLVRILGSIQPSAALRDGGSERILWFSPRHAVGEDGDEKRPREALWHRVRLVLDQGLENFGSQICANLRAAHRVRSLSIEDALDIVEAQVRGVRRPLVDEAKRNTLA